MLKRYILLPVALAAASGVPYVAVNKDLSDRFQDAYQEFTQTSAASNSELPGLTTTSNAAAPAPDAPGVTLPPPATDLNSMSETWAMYPTDPYDQPPPIYRSLYDVFRFDVSPAWVKSQWPRVSTGWLEDGYEGLRVALVTGTTPQDLHGSLTYFFDKQQRVQRIRFIGHTGDLRPLTELVTQYHGFRQQPTGHVALLTRSFSGRPTGVLRATHASVVEAGRARQQYAIVLEINSTAGQFQLSQELAALLESEKLSGRW